MILAATVYHDNSIPSCNAQRMRKLRRAEPIFVKCEWFLLLFGVNNPSLFICIM